MTEPAFAHVSLQTYLRFEAAAGEGEPRHEFWDGEVFAMGGASWAHNEVVANLIAWLVPALRGGPCRAVGQDQRVRISESRYVYPDVVVACPPELDDAQQPETLLNPKVVFEVLSKSTAGVDREKKRVGYQRLPSLTDYVLLDPETRTLEHYARTSPSTWALTYGGARDEVRLESLDVTLPMKDILPAEG